MSFSEVAFPWRDAGWIGTIPLPHKAKFPPPSGWTGENAPFPDDDQIAKWSRLRRYQDPNIGIRLGWPVEVNGIEYEVLGIDADQYDDDGKPKRGGDKLAALESELGPLPPTYVSTARARHDDGTDRGDWVSGIRFYLVPRGLAWRGDLGKGSNVEIIQKKHRFAAVWPSFNPKSQTTYRLYSPQSWAEHGQALNADEIPCPAEVAVLPRRWVDHLTQGRMRESPRPMDTDSSADELEQWALDQFQDAETMCTCIAGQLVKRKNDIAEDATSHSQVRDAHWHFLHMADEGHTGWMTAINEATEFWIQDVAAQNKRGYGAMRREIARSLYPAMRKLKSERESRRHQPWPECPEHPANLEFAVSSITFRNEDDTVAEVVPIRDGIDTPARARRNAPLDLRELRTTPPEPISWLLPDVLPRDSYVSLSAAPGTGKSLLTRAIAVDASLGRSAFDPAHELDPARVIYLDAENGQDWWRDGLNSMAAPLDLPNLKVVCYPDVGGLDTAKGAAEFHRLIADLADELDSVDLVVLDTVSRFIDGGENDADTWSQFYRLAIVPLRDQKVSVLRLDHLGKDADKGPRGSSHKLSDVDADFRMTAARAGSDDLTLTLGKRRRQHFAQTLTLTRKDGPLRHEIQTAAGSFVVRTADGTVTMLDPDANALVAELDRHSVNVGFGRDKAQTAYKQAGGALTARNDIWAAALKFRKERAKGSHNDAS